MTEYRKLSERIAEDNITSEAVFVGRLNEDGWTADHWRVELSLDGSRDTLSLPFKMGTGHNQAEPTVRDVLSAILSGAAGWENAPNFEDWANDYGYDTDSRKAERTYRLVQEQTERLRSFLGEKYDAYVWETEED